MDFNLIEFICWKWFCERLMNENGGGEGNEQLVLDVVMVKKWNALAVHLWHLYTIGISSELI